MSIAEILFVGVMLGPKVEKSGFISYKNIILWFCLVSYTLSVLLDCIVRPVILHDPTSLMSLFTTENEIQCKAASALYY